jgi:hypothetical protein
MVTLHDNEGIETVIESVHYSVLQEPTSGIVRIRASERERERGRDNSDNKHREKSAKSSVSSKSYNWRCARDILY